MKSFYYIFLLVALLYSCANPVAPSGGDRDQEAPEVKLSVPLSGSANFQGDMIEIEFNEYFTLLSSEENILITPSMAEKPKFSVKGKKLLIKLPDGLNPELTYSISFLDAIKDFNEGNILKNYKYVFSRGTAIDSASVSGKVVDAAFNDGLSDVFVGLYALDDSTILSESKPIYIARTNTQGVFTIDYVQNGAYIIAAIKDQNLNYIFDQVSEEVSLPSAPLNVNGQISLEQDIKLFTTEQKPNVEGYELLKNNKLYFYFSQEVEELALDILPYNPSNKAYLNKGNDTLFYHWTEQEIDHIDFFFGLDGGDVDTVVVPINDIEEYNKFELNAELNRKEKLFVTSPKPIKNVDASRIIVLDSLENKINFDLAFENESLIFDIKDLTTSKILVQIDSGAVTYYDASLNAQRFMKFVSIKPEQAKSKLVLSFVNTAPANAYLELLNKDRKKISSYDISQKSTLAIPNMKPGTYYVRIYDDHNQNGKWTTGNFELNRNPEKIYLISPSFEMKTNWDKDLSLEF